MTTHTESPAVKIGKMNTFTVTEQSADGQVLLHAGGEKFMLPDAHLPQGSEVGQQVELFAYPKNRETIAVTAQQPHAVAGECGLMEVITVTPAGAFMDWGIEKDLLVPVSQQIAPMQAGERWVVYVARDDKGGMIGSTKLHRFLDERAKDMTPGEKVDLLIARETGLGYRAVINGTHLGLLYRNEVFKPLFPGDRLTGFIKLIRDDRKIDLSLRRHTRQARQELTEQILEFLRANDGSSTLTDYSSPADIHRQYGVSKGSYKKALGALYKQRKIRLSRDRITLL